MQDGSKENKKGMDTTADDDSLGENTEKTPLTKEVEKERNAEENEGS